MTHGQHEQYEENMTKTNLGRFFPFLSKLFFGFGQERLHWISINITKATNIYRQTFSWVVFLNSLIGRLFSI